jgi:hypothetical protein
MSGAPVLQRLADQSWEQNLAFARCDASIMVKAAAIDVREFARFALSGLAATTGIC